MTCDICSRKFDGREEAGGYYYCCGDICCSRKCLDKTFEGTPGTWETHYTDDGECYWTVREVAA